MRTFTWTRSIKPDNQDAVAASPVNIVVADGATPLEDFPGAATATAKYAKAIVRSVSAHVNDPEGLVTGIKDALEDIELRSGETQDMTSTLSTVAWNDGRVCVALLGDSPVVLKFVDGTITTLVDPAFEDREAKLLTRVRLDAKAGRSWGEAYEKALTVLRADRMKRNTTDGLWVVSPNSSHEQTVRHLYVREWQKSSIDTIAVLSDGAYSLVSTFGLVELADIFLTDFPDRLSALWEEADSLQIADPEKSRFPRFSDRDDATVGIVWFNQDQDEIHSTPS